MIYILTRQNEVVLLRNSDRKPGSFCPEYSEDNGNREAGHYKIFIVVFVFKPLIS
jgi:hypothetical protein